MAPHALSWESDSTTSDTGDLLHPRSPTQRLSNLSQASTLVGSESDGIDIARRRFSTADQHPVTNGLAREHDAVEPHTLDQTGINEALNAQYRDMQARAIAHVRELLLFCGPIMEIVNLVTINMGEVERLLEAGQHLTAYYIFRDVVSIIDTLIRDDLDVDGLRLKSE
jgi:hypothetical protein